MSAPARIVSLLPAATEMVYALGAGPALVGRSHECDFPREAASLPVCSAPRRALDGDAQRIDAGVGDLVREGLSVFEVIEPTLAALAPDLILTQAQCAVCAVSLPEVEAAVARCTGARPRILSLEPAALRDVLADVQRVADALGRADAGRRLRGEMRERMRAIDGAANGIDGAPTVACIEWTAPLMVAGNWVPELLDLAGAEDLLARPGVHSPCIEWQQVLDADPDVLIVMPCGFDLARSRDAAAQLAQQPGFEELAAVQAGEVYAVDGHQYFNRPGPRLVESLEILAEILHPQRFDFGHEGTGWVRLTHA